MSLRRLVKKIGKVVKAVAPVAAGFIPGVGGVVAGALASKVAEKSGGAVVAPPPEKAPTGRALGIATQVIGGLSDLARSRGATTPQQAVSADIEPRVMRARRVGSMRTRLLEGVAPEQFDAVTPLGEAQSAALPPRRVSTGARQVSMIGNIVNAAAGTLRGRGPDIARSVMGWLPQQRTSGLTALPGAGFVTGGTLSTYQMPRRRRRMNPTNVHALRRSLRRVESFVKLEKRVDKAVNRLSRARGRANRSGFIRKRK